MANQQTAKNTVLLSTSGEPVADNVLTTSNVVMISPKTKDIGFQDYGNGALGNNKSIINEDYVIAEFTIDINAKVSGTLGAAPKYGELFKTCGLSETVDTGASVTYAPTTTPQQGKALIYLDGAKREVTGIASSFTFGGKIGEIAKFSFPLKGFTTLEEIVEANPSVTLDTNTNLVIQSITAITFNGNEIALKSFEFDMGADIQEIYALNTKEFYLADYKPTIKVEAIKTKGNFAHWSELNNNTQRAIVVTLGAGDGGTVVFSAPFCAPSEVSESEDAGKVVYSRTWLCQNSVGNDNFSVVYK